MGGVADALPPPTDSAPPAPPATPAASASADTTVGLAAGDSSVVDQLLDQVAASPALSAAVHPAASSALSASAALTRQAVREVMLQDSELAALVRDVHAERAADAVVAPHLITPQQDSDSDSDLEFVSNPLVFSGLFRGSSVAYLLSDSEPADVLLQLGTTAGNPLRQRVLVKYESPGARQVEVDALPANLRLKVCFSPVRAV